MIPIEDELAAIGFGGSRRAVDCGWRTLRLDAGPQAAPAPNRGSDPACSRELLRWRSILARGRLPSPYRISRA